MAKVLLVTSEDIVKHTAMSGNVDRDKFIQFLNMAQDIHIQNLLGTDLLVKIQTDIEAGTYSGLVAGDNVYNDLLTIYIKPTLIQFAMSEYLPWASYTVGNKGVYKQTNENGETVQKEEIDSLVQSALNSAQYYADRFVSHVCANSSDFPEYNSNSNGDVYPDGKPFKTNWVL